MRSGKLWVELLDVIAGLTDDLEVTDHGVLNQLGVHERLFVHVLGIAANAFDGLCDVGKLICKALLIAAYTGRASASTVARN